jgi:malate synthase
MTPMATTAKTRETGGEGAARLAIQGPEVADAGRVLTEAALAFVADLVDRFGGLVDELLVRRAERQARRDAGELPDFLPETAPIRNADWRVASLPADLEKRAVEITGPVERKMIINALNSGADVFMADFEDSCSPTWENVVTGQGNLIDAVRRTITFRSGAKEYALADKTAVLMVRPRGWHLREKHIRHRDRSVPAALVDFGLYVFHNAVELVRRGTGPYFYLPKMESHLEARLWNDVFTHAERALELPLGTIKATVLIETLPAAFEMDEILWELRPHAAGLNCGRWDYIFSFIKCLREDPAFVLPDRAAVTMTQPCMRAYTQLLVKTCHRRGAFAMGGMAAQIPIKRDPALNEAAIAKVRADKEREATDGHDGTWVAHPGLVPVAAEAFERLMPGQNQLQRLREDVHVFRDDLLAVPQGKRTDAALRWNIRVGVQYLEAWLRGSGCVPLYDLMEDAATAEISRMQIWQWLRHGVATDDGRPVTRARVEQATDEEMRAIRDEIGAERFDGGAFAEARALFLAVATDRDSFTDFLTLPAYQHLVAASEGAAPISRRT